MISEKTMATRLQEQGLRPTQQRLLIYRFLLENPIHPTADTIYAALAPANPVLSRTTVYNSLHSMEKAGLIRALPADMVEGEFRFDADTSAHGHFYCRGCGDVFDLPLGQEQLAALCPPSFTAEIGNVLFCGRCAHCSPNMA